MTISFSTKAVLVNNVMVWGRWRSEQCIYLQCFVAVWEGFLDIFQQDSSKSLQVMLFQQSQQTFLVFNFVRCFEYELSFRSNFNLRIIYQSLCQQPLKSLMSKFYLYFKRNSYWKWKGYLIRQNNSMDLKSPIVRPQK